MLKNMKKSKENNRKTVDMKEVKGGEMNGNLFSL